MTSNQQCTYGPVMGMTTTVPGLNWSKSSKRAEGLSWPWWYPRNWQIVLDKNVTFLFKEYLKLKSEDNKNRIWLKIIERTNVQFRLERYCIANWYTEFNFCLLSLCATWLRWLSKQQQQKTQLSQSSCLRRFVRSTKPGDQNKIYAVRY